MLLIRFFAVIDEIDDQESTLHGRKGLVKLLYAK